jgi:hypothetical protein
MLDTGTGEIVNLTLMHEGDKVREFYSQLPRPVLVGIEATGSTHWFLNLMEELGIECQVGRPAAIRAAEPRKQKHGQPRSCSICGLYYCTVTNGCACAFAVRFSPFSGQTAMSETRRT